MTGDHDPNLDSSEEIVSSLNLGSSKYWKCGSRFGASKARLTLKNLWSGMVVNSDDVSPKDKTILITGAASGLGKAWAKKFNDEVQKFSHVILRKLDCRS